jgi:hypothetical protein
VRKRLGAHGLRVAAEGLHLRLRPILGLLHPLNGVRALVSALLLRGSVFLPGSGDVANEKKKKEKTKKTNRKKKKKVR